MDISNIADELNAVVPGVTDAYQKLRATNGMGMYTSMGAFYNHTLFGRDASMSARFVADFDHAVAYDTIIALAALQGTRTERRTQEQPGRIHHELRDFTLWRPHRWTDRIGFALARLVWGAPHSQMLTYFAVDTTAEYIRLVNKYATSIDRSILDRTVRNRRGDTVSIRDSLAAAGNWIVDNIDTKGLFAPARTGRLSIWREAAERMRAALFDTFWHDESHFLATAIAMRDGHMQASATRNISAGWTLNSQYWSALPDLEREQKITAIVRELFSHDFLTQVGLRTRSRNHPEPLGITIDYHGSQTIWPMFNFMVAEGLRRHNLPRLAEQIERRIINGCNAVGEFSEFFIVDHADTLYSESPDPKAFTLWVQFIPEKYLAYTVVPMIALAYRSHYPGQPQSQEPWQAALEAEILATIPTVERYEPTEAKRLLAPKPVAMNRRGATMRSLCYMAREYWRMK